MKSPLVQTVVHELANHDAIVLTGYCYDLMNTPVYSPWIELFERYPADSDLPPVPDALKRGTGVGKVEFVRSPVVPQEGLQFCLRFKDSG